MSRLRQLVFPVGLFVVYETILLWFFGIPGFMQIPVLLLWRLLLIAGMLMIWCTVCSQLPVFRRSGFSQSLVFLCSSLLTGIALFFLFRIGNVYAVSFFTAFALSGGVYAVFHFLVGSLKGLSAVVRLDQQPDEPEPATRYLTITHTRGKTTLKIPLHAVICVEANDNYVYIHYLDEQGHPVRQLERLSMRKAEELVFAGTDLFARVHKSYLVNKMFVEEVTGRAQAYRIRLKHVGTEIPVSRKWNKSDLRP